MKWLTGFARTPMGRFVAAAIGLAAVAFLIQQSGPATVWSAITHAPLLFPLLVALEALLIACETWATFLLYGEERKNVPLREAVRSTLFCYALMAVVPFGRTAAEAARASMLGRYLGLPRAVAAAAQMQGLTLLGNALYSIPCAVGVYALAGTGWLLWAIAGNFVINGGLGVALFLAGRHSGIGKRLGKYFRGGETWGPQVDEHLKREFHLTGPMIWVTLSRMVQTVQRSVMLAAVGGGFGLMASLASQGIKMATGAVGDAIPGQVGISEAGYAMTANVLSLTAGDAIAMALLVHLAQIVWVGVGFLAPLFAPAPEVAVGASGSEKSGAA